MNNDAKSNEPKISNPLKNFLTVLSLSHFSQHLYVSRSVLYTFILNSLGLNYTQIGFAVGGSHTLGGLLQMVFSIAGRFVPKKILLTLSNISLSLALFCVGLSEKFLTFFSSQVVGEVGAAAIHPISVDLISTKYENKGVSTYIGLFYGLGYVGNIIGPLVLSYLALSYGWRYAFFISAIIPIFTGVLIFLFLHEDRKLEKHQKHGVKGNVLLDLKSIIREKKIIAMIVSQAFLAGGTGQGVIATFIPLFLSNGLNFEQIHASAIFSVAMLGGVIGTLLFGKYANKIGYLRTTMFCTCVASLSTFLLSLQGGYVVSLILNLIVLSLTTFPITSLMQSSLSKISLTNQRDLVLGLFLTVGFGVSSAWSTLIGYLIDLWGSFSPAWYVMSGLGLVALLFQFFAYNQIKEG